MRRGLNPYLLPLLAGIVVITAVLQPRLSACTLAIVGGNATEDGRPLLMKTRDNPEINQEYIYCCGDSASYAFIGITNAGITDQVWGGLNEVGFAVVDANAYNFEDPIAGPDDDGYIMLWALDTCQTVDDFQILMDLTDSTRTRPAIYGVIDAFGDAAFFEASAYEYYRYDLVEEPNGFMVRSTFAYSGDSSSTPQAWHRHDRAVELLDSASAAGCLSRQFLTQSVMRDLVGVTTNPYPLPFQGQEGSLPYGFINTNTEHTINRFITRSALVVQGILPTEDPLLSTLYAMAAEPISTIILPLWVYAGSVPVEFNGQEIDDSCLNVRAQAIRYYLYPLKGGSSALDTWRVVDQWDEGLLPFLFLLENQAFASGDSALNVWRDQGLPTPNIMESMQNDLAAWALAAMDTWGPPQAPEVSVSFQGGNQIQLNWPLVTTNVFCRPITVSSYTVYASDQIFPDRLAGDSLTTVSSPPVTISALETYRFFQVRCRP